MRAKLARFVRKEFDETMARRFPLFPKVTDHDVVSTGNFLYRSKITDEVYGFVRLQFHKHKDGFTINIARTRDKNCGTPRANFELGPESNFVRIHRLWGQQHGDFWFMLPDDLEYVRSLDPQTITDYRRATFFATKKEVDQDDIGIMKTFVDDAIASIEKYVIPYLGDGQVD